MLWYAERRRGFVLIEAVVALAILSLVGLALLQATGTQLRAASKAKVLLTEQALAGDRIGALRLLSYDDLRKLPDSLATGAFPPPFDEFTWTAQVDSIKGEYDLFGAQVTIAGRGETFPLETLIHVPRPTTETTQPDGRGGSPNTPTGSTGPGSSPAPTGRGGQ